MEDTDKKFGIYEPVKRILSIAVTVFMIVFPFITYFHLVQPQGLELEYFAKKSKIIVDYFYYYKEWTLLLFVLVLLTLLILNRLIYMLGGDAALVWKPWERCVFLCLAGFALLNILSCIFSKYKELTWWGLCIEYEGLAAILSYIVLFFAGYVLFADAFGRKVLKNGLRILMIFVGVVSVYEWAFGSVFGTRAVVELLTPKRYLHFAAPFGETFGSNAVISFGNPGYLGGLCAMLLPIAVGFVLEEKSWQRKAADGVIAGLLFAALLASGSSGAFYATLPVLALEFFFWRRQKGVWMSAGILLTASVFVAGGASLIARDSAVDLLGASAQNSSYEKGAELYEVETIQLEGGALHIVSEENELIVRISESEEPDISHIQLLDGAGKPLETKLDGGRLVITETEYEPVSVTMEDQIIDLELGYEDPVQLAADYSGNLYYISSNGAALAEIPQPEITGLERLYPLFTGRGYIWITALPLLKETLVLGKGIGTFPFYFHQEEAAGLLNTHGSSDFVIEKAHSWYLQTAIGTGMLSLLCMLILFGIHAVEGCVKYRKTRICHWEMGLFFGVLAFQITGLVNNSSITVNPIYWLLFGCSMCFILRA